MKIFDGFKLWLGAFLAQALTSVVFLTVAIVIIVVLSQISK